MRLFGMLDSPYVRRVAISLDLLGISFEHQSITVLGPLEQFRTISPIVEAPTLVWDDGGVLMDSSLILHSCEARAERSLWAVDSSLMQRECIVVGLALAGCEKGAEIVYQRYLQSIATEFTPWLARVSGHLVDAFAALEREVQNRPAMFADPNKQAAITAAVAWSFAQAILAPQLPAAEYPGLVALTQRLEQTAPFLKYPSGIPNVANHAATDAWADQPISTTG